MWYTIWVQTGHEEKIRELCVKLFKNGVYDEIFIPKCEQKRRYHGSWHLEKSAMFPGYVFVVTNDAEKLHNSLKNIQRFTKILGDKDDFIPLTRDEIDFLESFSGRDRIVKMSEGYMVGDRVVVTKGPMVDFDGKIKKVNRHKRTATIEISLLGKITEVNVGLEILHKAVPT